MEIEFDSLSEKDKNIYSEMEALITNWSKDGTETAGELTSKIMWMLKNPSKKEQPEDHSPYCPICTGCGEEGCCSPIHCQQHEDGYYCGSALRDLKFGYQMYKDVLDLIPNDEETETKFDKIWNGNYDIFYK